MVKSPNEDDWGKLKLFLKKLKGTKYMNLTLSIDTFSIIKWWVYAYNRTHMDYKGHNGSMMSLGKGYVSSYSRN